MSAPNSRRESGVPVNTTPRESGVPVSSNPRESNLQVNTTRGESGVPVSSNPRESNLQVNAIRRESGVPVRTNTRESNLQVNATRKESGILVNNSRRESNMSNDSKKRKDSNPANDESKSRKTSTQGNGSRRESNRDDEPKSRRESRIQFAMETLVRKRKSTLAPDESTKGSRRQSHITAFIQGPADFNSAANYDRRTTRSHIAFDNLVTRRGTTAGGVDEEAKPESAVHNILTQTHEWLHHYSSITQIHGIRWYNLAPNLLFRGFFVLFFLTFVITLPVYFVNEGFMLYNSLSLSKSIEWKRDSNLTYPNMTVCFAKFFDKQQLEAEGISNNLANYMTMALDPNVGHLVKYMTREVPAYPILLDRLQEELDRKLNTSNLTILELFHKVAIKCDNFITLCEVHRRFLFSGPDYPIEKRCCGALFNPKPFFSHTGTCFTTDATVYERTPFTFSSIKVWLNIQSANSPEFDLIFKGSDALERKGAYYTVSDKDHPITKLMQSPYKVPRRTNVLVSLTTRELDRTGLTANQFCRSDTEAFEKQYHVEYTKLNCDFFANSGFNYRCSLSPYYGVLIENEDPPCSPKDFLNSTPYFSDGGFNSGFGGPNSICLPTCLRKEHFTKITEGVIDPNAIIRFNNLTSGSKLGDPEDLVILQFYFNSFDYEAHTFSKPSLVDLLSKIGGWLGIINGSSIISVTELFILFSIFIFKLIMGCRN